MANNSYGKRLGDRKDGRQLRSLEAAQRFAAYAMPLIQGEPDYAWENGLPRFARLKKVLAE